MPRGVYIRKPRGPTSETTKKKISLAKKGIPQSAEVRAMKSELRKGTPILAATEAARKANTGKRRSEETRKILSEAAFKRYGFKRSSPQYRLIRTSLEYNLWRQSVYERDDWTCQQCNVRGGMLHAHHIKPFARYPELRMAIDNGITYCKGCHEIVHRRIKEAVNG